MLNEIVLLKHRNIRIVVILVVLFVHSQISVIFLSLDSIIGFHNVTYGNAALLAT